MVMPLHTIYSTFWNPSKSFLPCCCDPLITQCASWFYQLGSKHDPLSRATHYTAACVAATPPPSLPGMTTTSVIMELPVIVAFISGVKCPLNSSMISIPNFLTNTPGPFIPHHWQLILRKFICHPTFRLASENDSSGQLLLGIVLWQLVMIC